MGSFADYLENKLLDHVLGGPDYVRPATVYVGLSSTTITDAGGNITEPSSGGYARVAVTNNATNWPAAAAGAKSNGTVIEFAASTAAWLAGANLVDFFIADAASGGNIIGYGTLATPKAVAGANEVIRFPVGDLDVTLT